jgi:hypothetical protein
VYEWSNEEEWIPRGDTLIGESEVVDDEFGWSISLNSSGDTALVGTPDAGDYYQGIVYVYEWDAGGLVWNLKEKIQGGE